MNCHLINLPSLSLCEAPCGIGSMVLIKSATMRKGRAMMKDKERRAGSFVDILARNVMIPANMLHTRLLTSNKSTRGIDPGKISIKK